MAIHHLLKNGSEVIIDFSEPNMEIGITYHGN
jgi:hypothetical protein